MDINEIALLRRHYLHVKAGGALTEHDMSRHVEAAERMQQRLLDAEGERDDALRTLAESARQASAAASRAEKAMAETVTWKERAGERLHALRNIEREVYACVGSLTVTDLTDEDAGFAAFEQSAREVSVAKLRAWIDTLECPHAVGCATYQEKGVDCDCGLAELLAETKEAP